MDVNKAVRYVFDDKQWITKLLIGVLMTLFGFLIVPALILQGYLVRIVRQVMGGRGNELPEWSDYGKLLRDGFFVTVGQLVWMLPLILLMIIIGLSMGGFASVAENGSDVAGILAGTGGLLLLCVGLLLVVAALFLTPALLIQYAMKDDFGALFRFGEVFALIREHLSDILIAFLVTLVASFALGVVGSILGIIPCLGWIAAFLIGVAAGPYVSYVASHLYGQIAAKEIGAGGVAVYEKGPTV